MNPKSGFLLRLDFSGIVFVIYGTGIITYYYAYYCEPGYQILYISLGSLVSLIVIICLLQEKMLKDEYIPIKIMLYTILSICLAVPIIQMIYRRYHSC